MGPLENLFWGYLFFFYTYLRSLQEINGLFLCSLLFTQWQLF